MVDRNANRELQQFETLKKHHFSVLNHMNTGYMQVKVIKNVDAINFYYITELNEHIYNIFSASSKIKGSLLNEALPNLTNEIGPLIDQIIDLKTKKNIQTHLPHINKHINIQLLYTGDHFVTLLFRDITQQLLSERKIKEQTEEIQAQNEEIQAQNEELTATNEQLSESFDYVYKINLKLIHKEKELKDSNKLLHLVLDHMPARVFWKNTQSKYVGCNINFANDTGNTSFKDVIGKYDHELFKKEIGEKYLKDDQTVMHSGVAKLNYEEPQILSNGTTKWVRTNKVPLTEDSGQVIGVLGTYEDITELKRIEKELLIAKEKAEESDRLKSAFLANMSHEIRTPMNGIIGFSELLNNPELNDKERAHYTRIINDSGKQLLEIVNDIIDISKIEAGQVKLRKSKVYILDLIHRIVDLHKGEAKEKQLTIQIKSQLNCQDYYILQDSTKLFQILGNLISNAIKFTENGTITINCHSKNNKLSIDVSDTGIGIPANMHHTIFDRFSQGDHQMSNKIKGTGLGLAICKGLLKVMGGEIFLTSELQQGSTFTIELPVS